MCDVCQNHVWEKSYRQHVNSGKLLCTGQIRKINCSLCSCIFLSRAYEKHLRSEKQLVKTGHKIWCDKCQTMCNRIHRHPDQNVKCDFYKKLFHFSIWKKHKNTKNHRDNVKKLNSRKYYHRGTWKTFVKNNKSRKTLAIKENQLWNLVIIIKLITKNSTIDNQSFYPCRRSKMLL